MSTNASHYVMLGILPAKHDRDDFVGIQSIVSLAVLALQRFMMVTRDRQVLEWIAILITLNNVNITISDTYHGVTISTVNSIITSGEALCCDNRRLIGTSLIVIARQSQKNRD